MPPAIETPPITQAAITVSSIAAGDFDIGDGVARDPQIAAEARDRAGDAEGDELLLADVDAGIDAPPSGCRRRRRSRGPVRVKSRNSHMAAAIDDREPDRRREPEDRQRGNADEDVAHLVALTRLPPRGDEREAAIDRQRAERHDDRRDADASHRIRR